MNRLAEQSSLREPVWRAALGRDASQQLNPSRQTAETWNVACLQEFVRNRGYVRRFSTSNETLPAPPQYAAVDVIPCDAPGADDTTFDEHAATDRDILFYYAYSPLFTGIDSVRNSLLGLHCSSFTFVRDSGHVFVGAGVGAPVNVGEGKESDGGSVSVSLNESRDSVGECNSSYSWTAQASGLLVVNAVQSARNTLWPVRLLFPSLPI